MNRRLLHKAFLVSFLCCITLFFTACKNDKKNETHAVKSQHAETQQVVSNQDMFPQKPKKGKIITFQTGWNVVVRSLAVDGDTLWVGTSNGVMKINRRTEALLGTYNREHGLSNEYIFAIGIDNMGRKLFGTDGGGMSIYDDKKWKTYFPMHGLADYWVYSFAFDKNNVAWIGTWDGANRFDGKEFVTYREEDGLINIWVYGLDIDSKGTVWFGTEGGVSKFDGVSWKSWTHDDGLGAPNKKGLPSSKNTGLGTKNRSNLSVMPDMTQDQLDRTHTRHKIDGGIASTYNKNYVFCLKVDKNDNVWVGTWGGGVSKFDGTSWKNYTVDDGLAANIIYSIEIDNKGILWFGTANGVSRFDGKTFLNYSTQDGLLGNNVYAITVDDDNNKWFGHHGGVSKLKE